MEDQQPKVRGEGKEQQLSKIAAAINPASASEANSNATQSMLSSFVKHFETSALEIVQNMDDDQEQLIKKMVDEITKLQTKNMQEFEKAIGKISGLASSMMDSNNPKLKELGVAMQAQAKDELIKTSGFNLTGEQDTFRNRLRREIRGSDNTEQPEEKVSGIGKIKGFFSDTKKEFKKGFNAAVEEGSVADRVFRSDEEKRTRLLDNFEKNTTETKNETLAETFKKVLEETLKQTKEELKKDTTEKKTVENNTNVSSTKIEKLTDLTEEQKKILSEKGIAPTSDTDISYRKEGKPVSIKEINSALTEKPETTSSEQQEDKAGISKDAQIEALQKTAETNTIIQENSTESVDILKQMLDLMKQITDIMVQNGGSGLGGGGGGGSSFGVLDAVDLAEDFLPNRKTKGRGIFSKIGQGLKNIGGKIGRGAKNLLGFGGGATAAAEVASTGSTAVEAVGGVTKAAETASAAGKVTGGATSLASKAGGVLKGAGGILGKGLGVAGRVAGKLALPLAAGMAAYDAYKGWNADENATTGQKIKNAGRNVLSGLTFGLVDSTEDKIAAGEYKGTQKVQGTAQPANKENKGFFSENKGMLMGAALGPVGMLGGALYDKATANKTETGRNVDGALIEAGTEATKDKMKINIPPPTVINQGGGGGGQSAPTITAPGGVGSVRSDDPTWLMFQKRRAVA